MGASSHSYIDNIGKLCGHLWYSTPMTKIRKQEWIFFLCVLHIISHVEWRVCVCVRACVCAFVLRVSLFVCHLNSGNWGWWCCSDYWCLCSRSSSALFFWTSCAAAGYWSDESGKRWRDGGMNQEMSHFLCQILLFSTKPCYFHS